MERPVACARSSRLERTKRDGRFSVIFRKARAKCNALIASAVASLDGATVHADRRRRIAGKAVSTDRRVRGTSAPPAVMAWNGAEAPDA